MKVRLMYRCRVIFAGCPKQFLVEHDTPVKAVLALWKGHMRPESDSWELEDQDRFFPLSEPNREWEADPDGCCVPVFKQDMFDFRFIHDREMVQSLSQKKKAIYCGTINLTLCHCGQMWYRVCF